MDPRLLGFSLSGPHENGDRTRRLSAAPQDHPKIVQYVWVAGGKPEGHLERFSGVFETALSRKLETLLLQIRGALAPDRK